MGVTLQAISVFNCYGRNTTEAQVIFPSYYVIRLRGYPTGHFN